MAKLTKAQSRLHQDACNLLARPLSSPLTPSEKEFILTHWDPSANHINTVSGAFFTPLELARDLAHEAQTSGSVIDLCAGIGTLAYCMRTQGWPGQQRTHGPTVCVEINPAYVEVGKRILPEAHWLCLDVFSLVEPGFSFLRELTGGEHTRAEDTALWELFGKGLPAFDVAVSNPPFGFPHHQHKRAGGYPVPGCPLDLQVLAVAQRLAHTATFILSSTACPFEYSGRRGYSPSPSRHFDKFSQQTGIQSDSLCCASVDCAIYRDKWRGVMPNIELVTVDFTINDPDEQEQEGEGGVVMQDDSQGQAGGEQADASGGLLSLADIEKLIPEISYVTLCRYAQMYASELPSEGEGRKKRYYPEAVEVFRCKRAESTKGRKPGSASAQVPAPVPTEAGTEGQAPASPAPSRRRPGRPAGTDRKAGKRSPAQKRVTAKRAQGHGSQHTKATQLSPDASALSSFVSSASTLAMDRAVRELEIAQHVTRLEALKWGIAPVQAEIERLEKLIAQAQGRGEGAQ